MEPRVRNLRIVHLALLASLGLYIWIGEQIRRTPKTLDPAILKGLAVLASAVGAVALFIRLLRLPAAEEKLRLASNDLVLSNRWATDPPVARRWFFLHILSFALCESIALYGLLLRFNGASLPQVGGFYAGAIALMLLWTPRRP